MDLCTLCYYEYNGDHMQIELYKQLNKHFICDVDITNHIIHLWTHHLLQLVAHVLPNL